MPLVRRRGKRNSSVYITISMTTSYICLSPASLWRNDGVKATTKDPTCGIQAVIVGIIIMEEGQRRSQSMLFGDTGFGDDDDDQP